MRLGFAAKGLALLVLTFPLSLFAQRISITISPNPATVGAPLTLSVQDATGVGFRYRTNCLATTFHAGVPGGPIVPVPIGFCGTSFVTVGPNATATRTINAPATSGTVYWKVETYDLVSSAVITDWVCFHIQPTWAPSMQALTTARVGQDLIMQVNAPFLAGATYLTAGSLTTNVGITPVTGPFVSLDPDLIFSLTFPVPLAGVFDQFQGNLDTVGVANGVTVHIPSIPSLAYLPLAFQTAIFPPTGLVELTNVVYVCIQP